MKAFITFLLIIITAFPVQAQQTLCGMEEPPETVQEQSTLTSEEEQQAREIAKKFIERFEDNKDVLSLADNFYLNDFVSRFRDSPDNSLFNISPELWKKMSDSDVKKFYFRSLQFIYFGFMVYNAKETIHSRNQNPDEENNDLKPEEVFPPEVISLITKDETLRRICKDFIQEENEETKSQQEDELKTNEELQSLLKFFDDAMPLMKKHLESLDAPHRWEEFVKQEQKKDENENRDFFNPRVTILTGEFFGEAEGTRLICVNAAFFHIDLVKVDGNLKILKVYVEDD